MGRKIPKIFAKADTKNAAFETWSIVENSYDSGDYGFLMGRMILDMCKNHFPNHSKINLELSNFES